MDMVRYLPQEFRKQMDTETMKHAEEIRIRVGQPLELVLEDGQIQRYACVSQMQMTESLNYLTGYSLFALEEEMRQGFFTIEGGHRVGISGRTSYHREQAGVVTDCISDISAINIRIAHEVHGCAKDLIPWIKSEDGWYHTFLFSPPGVGKTTYLRDCIRILSSGSMQHRGYKVGVVDERSEIAACHQGVPQNDLGPRTDVLDRCPKSTGMLMLLRSMSPEMIAVDELGGADDFAAVETAMNSGVYVIGTIHASNVWEVKKKIPLFENSRWYDRVRLIGLTRQEKQRKIRVHNGRGELLWEN